MYLSPSHAHEPPINTCPLSSANPTAGVNHHSSNNHAICVRTDHSCPCFRHVSVAVTGTTVRSFQLRINKQMFRPTFSLHSHPLSLSLSLCASSPSSPMATTAFLLWSSSSGASASSGQEIDDDCSPHEKLLFPPGPPPKPKPRKAAAAKGPKRPPQRGLGVATLERLRRLEEQQKIESSPHLNLPQSPPPAPVFNIHHHSVHYSTTTNRTAVARYGTPVAYGVSGGYYNALTPPPPATGGNATMYYLPQCSPTSQAMQGYDAGASAAVRSVLHEQYAVDRYRASAGEVTRFRLAGTTTEPPSTQKPLSSSPECSNQCEFCARKKRLYGGVPANNCNTIVDHFDMDLTGDMAEDQQWKCSESYKRKAKASPSVIREREVKEFEFFPVSQRTSDGGDASSSSYCSSAAGSANLLDLSLKLSFY